MGRKRKTKTKKKTESYKDRLLKNAETEKAPTAKKKEPKKETPARCMARRGVHSCQQCCRVRGCQMGLDHLYSLGLIKKTKAVKPNWNEDGIFRIIGEMVKSAIYDYLRKEPVRKDGEKRSEFVNRHTKWEVDKTNAWLFLNGEFVKKTGLNVEYLISHQKAIDAKRGRTRDYDEEDDYYL